MTIEQVLMRAMKTTVGLTGGRGLTDSTLSRLVLAIPACGHISDAVEQYAEVSSAIPEQHIDLREPRKVRDKSDVDKIIDWFTAHSPFHQTPTELISLSTGIVADDETNCEQAYEFGLSEMGKLTGQTFIDVHYSRKRRVKSLATSTMGVKLRNDVVDVNPQQLFNRIICVIRSDADLADCFKYELSPTSASLFDNRSMREINKASLAKIIEKYAPCANVLTKASFVIDGRHLLHRVVWPRRATYNEVIETIGSYVCLYYEALLYSGVCRLLSYSINEECGTYAHKTKSSIGRHNLRQYNACMCITM